LDYHIHKALTLSDVEQRSVTDPCPDSGFLFNIEMVR